MPIWGNNETFCGKPSENLLPQPNFFLGRSFCFVGVGGQKINKNNFWPIFSPFQANWNNVDLFLFLTTIFSRAPLFFWGGGEVSNNQFWPVSFPVFRTSLIFLIIWPTSIFFLGGGEQKISFDQCHLWFISLFDQHLFYLFLGGGHLKIYLPYQF